MDVIVKLLSGRAYDLFLLALIAVGGLLVWRRIKKKNTKPVKVAAIPTDKDLARLPNDLKTLRRKVLTATNPQKAYNLRRKLCLVGIEQYRSGKITDWYALDRILNNITDTLDYVRLRDDFPEDPVFEFHCMKYGMEIYEYCVHKTGNYAAPRSFLSPAWDGLARAYSEGTLCPRNAKLARKYLNNLLYNTRAKFLDSSLLERLMEVPGPGAVGSKEITEWITRSYQAMAGDLHAGFPGYNWVPPYMYQAALLLFEMDLSVIGGDDVAAMLAEYRRHAEKGNAYAQYKLGDFYYHGKHGLQDRETGLELVRQADRQGLYLAAELLNKYYRDRPTPAGASQEERARRDREAEESQAHLKTVERNVVTRYAPILARMTKTEGVTVFREWTSKGFSRTMPPREGGSSGGGGGE